MQTHHGKYQLLINYAPKTARVVPRTAPTWTSRGAITLFGDVRISRTTPNGL